MSEELIVNASLLLPTLLSITINNECEKKMKDMAIEL